MVEQAQDLDNDKVIWSAEAGLSAKNKTCSSTPQYYHTHYLSLFKEWILEIMAEFLQSPLWKNPIISFVEENCVIFENTEENRLDYTEVHSKFKRLVESKLEAYIQDLGISQSDFVMAQQRASKRIHKSLLQ